MLQLDSLTTQLLFSTVRIVGIGEGSPSAGTGFFFGCKIDEKNTLEMIITNKHVIRGQKIGKLRMHEQDPTTEEAKPSGRHFDVEISDFEEKWIFHPNTEVDLCAMPVTEILQAMETSGRAQETIFEVCIDPSMIWTDEQLINLRAIEDVYMIGYPNSLWDSTNNLPIARRGTTASHPGIDFEGRSEMLVDIACFPGSSGSPVFLLNEGGYPSKAGGLIVGQRVALLGVLHAGPVFESKGQLQRRPIPVNHEIMPVTPMMMHLGYLIKSREIAVLCDYIRSSLSDLS